MNDVSARLSPVMPSASAVVSQAARAAGAAGEDVIDLGLGEPDFETPAPIVEAAYAVAKAGQTQYPPNDGMVDMTSAVIAKLKRPAKKSA